MASKKAWVCGDAIIDMKPPKDLKGFKEFPSQTSAMAFQDIEYKTYGGKGANIFGKTQKEQRQRYVKEYKFNPF